MKILRRDIQEIVEQHYVQNLLLDKMENQETGTSYGRYYYEIDKSRESISIKKFRADRISA